MNLNLYEMRLKRKNISRLFMAIFVIVLAGFFITKYLVTSKIESYVENLPNHIDLKYGDIDLQIFSGSLNLDQVMLTIKGQTTDDVNAQIKLNSIKIENLSYLDYLFKDDITIETIALLQPKITYYHNDKVKNESYNSVFKNNLGKTIRIHAFEAQNTEVEVLNIENDSLMFSTENLDFKLNTIVSNSLESKDFPIEFETLSLTSENLMYSLSEYENLSISSLAITTQNAGFSNVELKTKYSKSELSKRIESERDHFDLRIASVDINNYQLKSILSSNTSFTSENININFPEFHIYRDKLIADDLTRKPLYSKMLRSLKFGLNLKELMVNKAKIIYEENVKSDSAPGKLQFSELDATIKNITNLKSASDVTSISISSNFMKDTPLNVNWNFDVNDVNDEFIFKAEIGMLKAEHLNAFMQPNLNLKLEGELIKTYFTIDGNANTSQIDLKTDYDQFDIIILKENGKEKNKFLSGLINLFIAEDSKDDDDRFRQSDTKTLERDKTKSIFNFVWQNAKSGLISAMAGDGEKDN